MRKEIFNREINILRDTYRRLLRRNAKINLIKLTGKTHPADLAEIFRHFSQEEQIEIFVKEVKANTSAKIAITTLPWLGEQEDASIMNVIKSHNKIIKAIAVKYDLFILDLFSKFREQIASSNDSIPYTTSELRRLRGLRAVILYYIFGWSWTKIGEKYKLKLLCDHIHLNEKGGDLMEQLAKEFLSS